jgi:hypothetical protein
VLFVIHSTGSGVLSLGREAEECVPMRHEHLCADYPAANAPGAFEKIREIKNPAPLLAFACQEIKQIKEIKRRGRSPRLVGRGSSTELVSHFEIRQSN